MGRLPEQCWPDCAQTDGSTHAQGLDHVCGLSADDHRLREYVFFTRGKRALHMRTSANVIAAIKATGYVMNVMYRDQICCADNPLSMMLLQIAPNASVTLRYVGPVLTHTQYVRIFDAWRAM